MQYTMSTPGGVSVSFMSYGSAITRIVTPDRRGAPATIVLGFPTPREYETKGAEGGLSRRVRARSGLPHHDDQQGII